MLILKHPSKSRPSDRRSDVDYDVYADERNAGWIMRTHAAPEDNRWFRTITARIRQSTPDPAYATTREEAMAYFKTVGARKPRSLNRRLQRTLT